MYNRKERRTLEKKLKINRLLKTSSKDAKEEILAKRAEHSKACQEQFVARQEAYDKEYLEEWYSKRLRFYTEAMGHSLEEAEKIVEREMVNDEKRREKKKKMNEPVPNV
jgi:hypothetical protein